jgi:hypothetical protein
MGKEIANLGQFTGQEAKQFLLQRMQAVEPMPPEEAEFLGSKITAEYSFDAKQTAMVSKWGRFLGVAFAADVRDSNDFRSVRAQYRAAVASLLPGDVLFHVAHQTRLVEEDERESAQRGSRRIFLWVTLLVVLMAALFVLAMTGRLGWFK